MYRTVIANVMGKECRDEAGRTLTRIGNMPVRAGDAVWTDGRCIYGNELFGSDAPMLFFEESLAGIPLNAAALVSLLVYSKDHSIQRLGWPKWNSYFANNEKWYAIVPTAKNFSDMDIMGNGGFVAIYNGSAYNRDTARYSYKNNLHFFRPSTDSDEIYTYKNYNKFCQSLEYGATISVFAVLYHESTYTFTSQAHPERNESSHGSDRRNTRPVFYNYQIESTSEDETDYPVYLYRNNDETKISLKQYADYAENVVLSVMNEQGTSEYIPPVIKSKDCSLLDSRVDDKGNYYLVLDVSCEGYCFQDYSQTCLILGCHETTDVQDYDVKTIEIQGETYKWDTKETKVYDRKMAFEGTNGTRVSTFGIDIVCNMKLFVKNSDIKIVENNTKVISRANGKSYSTYIYKDDTGFNADCIIHQVWKGEGGAGTLGMFLGDFEENTLTHFTYPKAPKIKLLDSYAITQKEDYIIPIQDAFTCKNSDYTKVYKGDSLVVQTEGFAVGGITEVNEGEYLLQEKGGRRLALYKDGELTYPETNVYGTDSRSAIEATNTRLRWMEHLDVLKQ